MVSAVSGIYAEVRQKFHYPRRADFPSQLCVIARLCRKCTIDMAAMKPIKKAGKEKAAHEMAMAEASMKDHKTEACPKHMENAMHAMGHM